jgi:hypothetical protein
MRALIAIAVAFALSACGESPDAMGAGAMIERLRSEINAQASAQPPADASFDSMAALQQGVSRKVPVATITALCAAGGASYSLSALPGKIAIYANCNGKEARAEWSRA